MIQKTETDKEWGIDITGRKMWYEPWPVNQNGSYRSPTDDERSRIYGISGKAVRETLLYFEERALVELDHELNPVDEPDQRTVALEPEYKTDTLSISHIATDYLVQMLNDHVIEEKYYINRDELLDERRWYNNEYFFYFIMLTKKIIGRYDFHFGEKRSELLSEFHRPYEQGFIKFTPWSSTKNDNSTKEHASTSMSGGFAYCIHKIESREKIEIFEKELVHFISKIIPLEYSLTFTVSAIKKELNWYSSEFVFTVFSFFQIFSNVEFEDITDFYLKSHSSLMKTFIKGAPLSFQRVLSKTDL